MRQEEEELWIQRSDGWWMREEDTEETAATKAVAEARRQQIWQERMERLADGLTAFWLGFGCAVLAYMIWLATHG